MAEPAAPAQRPPAETVDPRLPSITESGDESGAAAWNWQPPQNELRLEDVPASKREAERALSLGELFAEADDAIPLFLSLKSLAPEDKQVANG